MDSQKQAAALNQLSRLLFDQAAFRWQLVLAIQLVAGIIGLVVSLIAPSTATSAGWALLVLILLGLSYWVRFLFEDSYDVAETMRRQSVLSEGLNWALSRAQFNEWKSRAGKKLLNSAATNPRPDDYYETQEASSPKRLAEMTFQSLFWTKNLYRKLQFYISVFIAVVGGGLMTLLLASPLTNVSHEASLYIAYSIYLFVPVIISIDAVGLLVKLQRTINALCAIEPHIESLAHDPAPLVEEVMRLVSEYNCAVSVGVPIPKWVFRRHHDEIEGYWS